MRAPGAGRMAHRGYPARPPFYFRAFAFEDDGRAAPGFARPANLVGGFVGHDHF
jgi:hypothetical protein